MSGRPSRAAVAALCRDAGYRADGQTGADRVSREGDVLAPDVAVCLRLAGIAMPSAAWPLLTSYRFTPACSPHLAAARAGIRISVAKIARDLSRRCYGRLASGGRGPARS